MKILLIVSTFIWCGLLMGVSFMEAPLKFQAPDVTLKIGLGIGQLVFGMLNKMELVLAALIVVSLFRLKHTTWKLYLIPLGLLCIQSIYLLPQLSTRIDIIQSGQIPPASNLHLFYIAAEAIKLIVLLMAGVLYTRSQFESSKSKN